MITTTPAFLTSAIASVRKPKARVMVTWSSSEIDTSEVITTSGSVYGDNPAQVYDGVTAINQRFWILGTSELGGTEGLGPSAGEQIGWRSDTFCDSAGDWATSPYVRIDFNDRPITNLVVAGDAALGEYPVDFGIDVHATGGSTYTTIILGNTEIVRNVNVTDRPAVDWVKLRVTKWSTPNSQAKICEFSGSVIGVYEGDDIASLSILEESEIRDGTIPIGNISANEIDLSLSNIKLSDGTLDPFFIDNTNSLYSSAIIPGRKIEPYLGFELPTGVTEWVKMGTYWSQDWKYDDMGVVVTTSARDRMDRLRNGKYNQAQIYNDTSLYDFLETILNDAKTNLPMADLTWDITTELQSLIISWAWVPVQSYFEAIRQVCGAGMCQAWISRDDVLIVGRTI